jgi:hypothetical protein
MARRLPTGVAIEGIERFTVEVHDPNPAVAGDAWMDEVVQRLGRETETQVVRSETISIAGVAGREVELSAPRRSVRTRMFAVGRRQYRVTASAPTPNEHQRRFIESFTIVAPAAAP